MEFNLRFILISLTLLILSCNIYLNLQKESDYKQKNFSKDIFKLYYFSVNGRAIIIRALFSYSKVKFENIFVDKNWGQLKSDTSLFEFGQVPILIHNEKILSQSKAIYLYLARLFNLYGNNLDDEYQIDSLLNSYDDISKFYTPLHYPKNDEEKNNQEKYKEIFRKEFKRFLEIYEQRYKKLGSGKYYLGNYFSLADIYLTTYLNVFAEDAGGIAFIKDSSPKLAELIEKIKNNELKEFFDKYYRK